VFDDATESSQARGVLVVAPFCDVRFGSEADIGACPRDVRFTPKADIADHDWHVRLVPFADRRPIDLLAAPWRRDRSKKGKADTNNQGL